MDFWDIMKYARLGQTLERAEKHKFSVSTAKVKTGVDTTEEIKIGDLSEDFQEIMKEALKAEYARIQEKLVRLIKNET